MQIVFFIYNLVPNPPEIITVQFFSLISVSLFCLIASEQLEEMFF